MTKYLGFYKIEVSRNGKSVAVHNVFLMENTFYGRQPESVGGGNGSVHLEGGGELKLNSLYLGGLPWIPDISAADTHCLIYSIFTAQGFDLKGSKQNRKVKNPRPGAILPDDNFKDWTKKNPVYLHEACKVCSIANLHT